MTQSSQTPPVQIGTNSTPHAPLGMGCSFYGISDWHGQEGQNILSAMATALDNGITHFDTATGYGGGESEKLIGRFLADDSRRRDKIFLASKVNTNTLTKDAMLTAIDESCQRLQTDVIDLYYIHWPRTGKDLRPLAEGLEIARQQGKIRAVGVSNFSIEQMQQVAEVTQIDAHQLGYNLLWRFPEKDIIPYCADNNIAVVVYSALAHGILSGKYARQLTFDSDDQRWSITLFRDAVWGQLYEYVQQMKSLADRTGHPLVTLALRWLLHQSAVTAVLVSAKNSTQAQANADILNHTIDPAIFEELTAISDNAMTVVPDEGNPFGYHP